MKRASRTGPSAVMKEGTTWLLPERRSRVAKAICGLTVRTCPRLGCGLVPPTAGWAWHAAQLFALKVGPRPLPSSPATPPETESTSMKTSRAALKKLISSVPRPRIGPPALAEPPRGPGSVWADAAAGKNAATTTASTHHLHECSSRIPGTLRLFELRLGELPGRARGDRAPDQGRYRRAIRGVNAAGIALWNQCSF